MKLIKFIFKENFKGFKSETAVSFNDSNINLIVGQNGSGKSLFFEALIKSFYFLYLLDLEKKLKYSFDLNFDFLIHYKINNKDIEAVSEKGKITIKINNKIDYDFLRSDIPSDYNLDRFFPERIIALTNSSNDKIYYICYAFEIVRKIKEHIMGFSTGNNNFHENIRLLFINNYSIDSLTECIKEYENDMSDVDYPKNLVSLIKKTISTNVETERLKKNHKFDKNTFFTNSWRDFYKVINIKSYDRYGDYKRYYGEYISLKDTRIATYFDITNTYSKDINIRNLSAGEFDYLRLFLTIDIFNERYNSLYVVDEIDAHFNPKWCKEYISDLFEIFDQNSQILISTNNPFAISDIEKDSVVLFEKHEVVNIEFETFGMNSNLLNNKFFNIEGTLSKRAFNKLENINKKIKDKCDLQLIKEELKGFGESPEKTIIEFIIRNI
jgi:hypothetical protein